MRLTVVPDDRCIIKDGDALVFDFESDPDIHAVQWYGTHGVIERKQGAAESFTDPSIIAPFLAAWQAERDRLDAPLPPPEPPTPEQTMQELTLDVQQYIDQTAQQRRYDNINSVSKYKDITDAEIAALPPAEQPIVTRYRAECRALGLFAARCWAKCEQVLAAVQAGERAVPTKTELLAELPPMEWPA